VPLIYSFLPIGYLNSAHAQKISLNVLPIEKDTQTIDDEQTTKQSVRPQRVLCWVLTSPKNKQRATIVKETWGRRCDKLLFMSSKNDTSLPTVVLNVTESRAFLWNKVVMTLSYINDNFINDYDWFFKADDDT